VAATPSTAVGAGGAADERELAARLARIRLVVLDVDGTLTDGSVSYAGSEELVRFDVHDGLGLVWLKRAEVTLAWISGRGSRAVETRAAELGVREVFLHVGDKLACLAELQTRLGLAPELTLAMGDDVVDLMLLPRVAVFVAPANARPEVRARAHWVTQASGGRGAVRELAERLLAARGAVPHPFQDASGAAR
jgi:3-deoxy-D-manno-octulosonate 8-phosphate phosphatase (KDO 8-P phosphatase)